MKLLLSLVSLLQLAPATESPFALEVSLPTPPECASAASLVVGTLAIPASARAATRLHVALCDGRRVDIQAEVERSGDTFLVKAANDSASSNTFLLAGQYFDATLGDLRLRFTVNAR